MWNLEKLTFISWKEKNQFTKAIIYLFHTIHMVQPIEISNKNKNNKKNMNIYIHEYWKTRLFYDEARLVQDVNNATNIIHWNLWIKKKKCMLTHVFTV